MATTPAKQAKIRPQRLIALCDAIADPACVFVSLRWSSLPAAKIDESKIAICGVCGDVLSKKVLNSDLLAIVTVFKVQTEV